MNMVAHHISLGPEAGSSVGKNIFILLPTLIGIIQTFLHDLASKNLKKTNRMTTKKTTIQFRKKNPIRKNSILVFFSVLKCVLTFIYDAGNPNNSGKIGKNQKNKIFLSEILPSENKNTKFVNSVNFLSKKCLQDPPPPKKSKKICTPPPCCKNRGFLSGEIGCKDNFNLPPPQLGGWRLVGERSEFSSCCAMPSHQSFNVKHKVDIAIGGEPRGGPLFPPRGKGQKQSRIAPNELEKKNSVQNPNFKQKTFLSAQSNSKTKNKSSEKISKQFFSTIQNECKWFSTKVPKNEKKNLFRKFFFRNFEKNGNSKFLFFQFNSNFKTTKITIWCKFSFFIFLFLYFPFYGSTK